MPGIYLRLEGVDLDTAKVLIVNDIVIVLYICVYIRVYMLMVYIHIHIHTCVYVYIHATFRIKWY
jgi:hypothetical protein